MAEIFAEPEELSLFDRYKDPDELNEKFRELLKAKPAPVYLDPELLNWNEPPSNASTCVSHQPAIPPYTMFPPECFAALYSEIHPVPVSKATASSPKSQASNRHGISKPEFEVESKMSIDSGSESDSLNEEDRNGRKKRSLKQKYQDKIDELKYMLASYQLMFQQQQQQILSGALGHSPQIVAKQNALQKREGNPLVCTDEIAPNEEVNNKNQQRDEKCMEIEQQHEPVNEKSQNCIALQKQFDGRSIVSTGSQNQTDGNNDLHNPIKLLAENERHTENQQEQMTQSSQSQKSKLQDIELRQQKVEEENKNLKQQVAHVNAELEVEKKKVTELQHNLAQAKEKEVFTAEQITMLRKKIDEMEKKNKIRDAQEIKYQAQINRHDRIVAEKNEALGRAQREIEQQRLVIEEYKKNTFKNTESPTNASQQFPDASQLTGTASASKSTPSMIDAATKIRFQRHEQASKDMPHLCSSADETIATTVATSESSHETNPQLGRALLPSGSKLENSSDTEHSTDGNFASSPAPARMVRGVQPLSAVIGSSVDMKELESTIAKLQNEKSILESTLARGAPRRTLAERRQRAEDERRNAELDAEIHRLKLILRTQALAK